MGFSLLTSVSAVTLMDAATVLLIAAFVPLLAIVSIFARTDQAKQKLDAAIALYDLKDDRYLEMYKRQKQPALWKQAWLPILIIFLIGLYFAYLTIFTGRLMFPELASKAANGPSNLLILGPKWLETLFSQKTPEGYRIGTVVAMSYAYLGWYIWSIATIFSRFSTLELVAATYMNVMIRLVMAVLLTIVIRHMASFLWAPAGLLSPVAIGFGVGVFPDAALTWLTRELRDRLLGEKGATVDSPLDLIQGVSPFRKTRLYEMGMDNCQNLAECNPIQLFVSSNLGLLEVLDWIGQAQLVVLVGQERFLKLQANGWRRAADFERACRGPAKPVVATLIGYDERQLDDLSLGLREDPNFARAEALVRRIQTAEGVEAQPRPIDPSPALSLPAQQA